jgi:hypothetical protein
VGFFYGFYGPSALVLNPLSVYCLLACGRSRPLIVTALIVVAAAIVSQAYGGRLVCVFSSRAGGCV